MNLKKLTAKFLLGCTVSFALFSQAQAGLINVSYIKIANSIGHHTQVAEVIALDMFNNDVALLSAGAIASAPNQWSSITSPGNAIDGDTSGRYPYDEIYHDASGHHGTTLTITLPTPQEIFSIDIFGRSDCCDFRDVFNVGFFDVNGNELYTTSFDARYRQNIALELPNTAEVPEPAGIALLASGLLIMGARRARRQNK